MVALTVATMVFAGVIAGLIQSRRLTESSIAQNIALTAVESYIEQMKNLPVTGPSTGAASPVYLVNLDATNTPILSSSYAIPTVTVDTTGASSPDWLWTSTGTPPDITTLTPGVTPSGSGIVDNLKDVPADPNSPGPALNWQTVGAVKGVWPGAQNYPTTTPYRNNVHINLWVWVNDLTPNYTTISGKAFGITVIYTWSNWDGFGTQYHMGSIRTVVQNTAKNYGVFQ